MTDNIQCRIQKCTRTTDNLEIYCEKCKYKVCKKCNIRKFKIRFDYKCKKCYLKFKNKPTLTFNPHDSNLDINFSNFSNILFDDIYSLNVSNVDFSKNSDDEFEKYDPCSFSCNKEELEELYHNEFKVTDEEEEEYFRSLDFDNNSDTENTHNTIIEFGDPKYEFEKKKYIRKNNGVIIEKYTRLDSFNIELESDDECDMEYYDNFNRITLTVTKIISCSEEKSCDTICTNSCDTICINPGDISICTDFVIIDYADIESGLGIVINNNVERNSIHLSPIGDHIQISSIDHNIHHNVKNNNILMIEDIK